MRNITDGSHSNYVNDEKEKRYILTAIDYLHKIGYARVYKMASSLSAFDFLLRLNVLGVG